MPEAETLKTVQSSEIQKIMTRTGWDEKELSERAGLAASTVKRAVKGWQPLSSYSMHSLRYAAEKHLGAAVNSDRPLKLPPPLDPEVQNQIAHLVLHGQPEHLSLLKSLINVVYEQSTGRVQVKPIEQKPPHIIHLPQGYQLRPVLGDIAAGMPQEAIAQAEQFLAVAPRYASQTTFVLRVCGDSMVDRGINEGDLVYMNAQKEPRDGDIVAALCDHETCLKTYVTKGKGVPFLRSENRTFPSKIVPLDELTIQGVMIGKHVKS